MSKPAGDAISQYPINDWKRLVAGSKMHSLYTSGVGDASRALKILYPGHPIRYLPTEMTLPLVPVTSTMSLCSKSLKARLKNR